MYKNKGLKAAKAPTAAKAAKALLSVKKITKYVKRKGGDLMNPQINLQLPQQQPQQYPQQPQQPQQQQPGFIGTAFTDLKNNKDVLQPIYDTTSSIGLVYTFLSALFSSAIGAILIFIGYQVNSYNSVYKGKTVGTVISVECYTEENDKKQRQKKCDTVIEYEVDGTKYKKSFLADEVVNVNQNITIHYDPANPNNFTTKYDLMVYLGWGLIITGILAIVVSWVWFILSWIFKPIAAASGVGVIGDALTPNE
jgi:hypothetical protein